MELHIFDNKEIMSDKLASWICDLVAETLKKQEFFSLVLSGGETPKLLYEKLATPGYKNKINWNRIHIFWGDERVVPFTDDRNNAHMAFDILLDKVDIPSNHIHFMRTDIQPNFAVDEYRKLLHDFFDSSSQSFDLVLLGMGDDAHTLSLFPGSPIINEHVNWVNAVYNEKQKMYRITLMPLIVNKAAEIVFMVTGSQKASVLKEVLEGERNPEKLPAQSIVPVEGKLHWFLDKEVAKDLA
ncbi:MAG TPA: 6-phosphogluconolactonase [Hanamia sp.]|jgi:6-phosphogluconolactonase|nr:6-phosphogluconolactonase [Hanamia sp.]